MIGCLVLRLDQGSCKFFGNQEIILVNVGTIDRIWLEKQSVERSWRLRRAKMMQNFTWKGAGNSVVAKEEMKKGETQEVERSEVVDGGLGLSVQSRPNDLPIEN